MSICFSLYQSVEGTSTSKLYCSTVSTCFIVIMMVYPCCIAMGKLNRNINPISGALQKIYTSEVIYGDYDNVQSILNFFYHKGEINVSRERLSQHYNISRHHIPVMRLWSQISSSGVGCCFLVNRLTLGRDYPSESVTRRAG